MALKFKENLESGDAELRFTVLEDRGDRVLVTATINQDMPIPPTHVYLKSDLVEAND